MHCGQNNLCSLPYAPCGILKNDWLLHDCSAFPCSSWADYISSGVLRYDARLKSALLNKLPIALISLLIYIIISKFLLLPGDFFFHKHIWSWDSFEQEATMCIKWHPSIPLAFGAIRPLSPEWPVESQLLGSSYCFT